MIQQELQFRLKNLSFVCRDKFSGEKVPTLQEAVEECIRHQLTVFFDVKGQPDKVLNILTSAEAKKRLVLNVSIHGIMSLQTCSVQ